MTTTKLIARCTAGAIGTYLCIYVLCAAFLSIAWMDYGWSIAEAARIFAVASAVITAILAIALVGALALYYAIEGAAK